MAWDPKDKPQWCSEAFTAAMVDAINLFSRETLVGSGLLTEAYWSSDEALDLRNELVIGTQQGFVGHLEGIIDAWGFGALGRTRQLFRAAMTAGIDAWCTELVSREALSVDFTSKALRARRIQVTRLFAKRWASEVKRVRQEKLSTAA